MTDWSAIREEYVTGALSYQKLGEKYGISRSRISAVALREHWVSCREAHRKQASETIPAELPPEEPMPTLQSVADKLLRRIEASVDDREPLDVKDLRALVSALKDLIAIREACPELEHQARVTELEEKLNRGEGGLRVIFDAGEEEWNA